MKQFLQSNSSRNRPKLLERYNGNFNTLSFPEQQAIAGSHYFPTAPLVFLLESRFYRLHAMLPVELRCKTVHHVQPPVGTPSILHIPVQRLLHPSLPLLLPFPAQGIQQLPTIAIHHGRRNEKHRFIEIFHLATIVLRVPALPQLSHHTFHLCGIRGHLERLVTPYHHGNPILVRGYQYQPGILRIHVNLHFNLSHGSPFSKTCYKRRRIEYSSMLSPRI